MYNWMKWLRFLGGWHFIAATAINPPPPPPPPKQHVSLQLMTSCCMNFAIIIQWIYFTIWEKIKKNRQHYNTILSFYNIKTLQEEFAKKSNIPWIWRIIYGHKLPYMKKIRKKKQVCGAACFMAAEIKYSKDVRPLPVQTCIMLWVCSYWLTSVRVCSNHLLVRAITQDPFKLGSPNLDQTCKRPWLRSLLFFGAIDRDLQGQI